MAPAFAPAPCDADTIRQGSLRAHEGLSGRYGDGLNTVVVAPCGTGLAVQPALSANPALLVRVGTDRYAFLERPERQIEFRRSASGSAEALSLVGSDRWLRRVPPVRQVWDDLLDGRAAVAAARVGRPGEQGFAEAAEVAQVVLARLPSRRGAVAEFLDALAPRAPDLAAFHRVHGDALAAVGRVAAARRAYHQALDAGAAVATMQPRLRMAGEVSTPAPNGWSVPFTMAQLLAPPTTDEMQAVRLDWRTRTLAVSAIEEVHHQPLPVEGGAAREAVVLSYRVDGARHFGVVLLPRATGAGCCAVIVDIKGTTPDYAPLAIERQLPRSLRELGSARDNTLVVLPGLRGERIELGGRTFVSDGDRRDGWDGAADDARALLTAVLTHYPQADPQRACAFGHSRGGTVALLAAARDRRFGCVAAEAGPVDWFALMAEDGWPLPAAVAEGLNGRSQPGDIGGQFIERFLAPVIAGEWTLAQARHRMLASSPLYFANQLPATLAVYGGDDASVPVANGLALRSRFQDFSSAGPRAVIIQRATGHDLDPITTPLEVGRFLLSYLRLDADGNRKQVSEGPGAARRLSFVR